MARFTFERLNIPFWHNLLFVRKKKLGKLNFLKFLSTTVYCNCGFSPKSTPKYLPVPPPGKGYQVRGPPRICGMRSTKRFNQAVQHGTSASHRQKDRVSEY